jgi:hypothetical protein
MASLVSPWRQHCDTMIFRADAKSVTNILITLHTIKMFLAGGERSSIHQRCAIASELLDELTSVPTAYIDSFGISSVSSKDNSGQPAGTS